MELAVTKIWAGKKQVFLAVKRQKGDVAANALKKFLLKFGRKIRNI
ncbi:hypothetical protein [Megasphaera stantonii]|nr:hypothetical protein [Megasphaera stantonii]